MLRILVFLFCFWPLAVFPQAVPAQGTGLQVSLIPAGLRALMVDNAGRQAIWSFLGRQGDVWVAELRGEAGEPIRTEHYNAQGYLVATLYGDGGKVTYAPYRCGDRLGRCSYTRTGPDGSKQRYSSDVRKTGSTYTVYINGKATASYKLGSYNIRTMIRQGNDWTKLKRIEN
jgi:hypothetical protein